MKKLVSIFLALAILLAVSIPALADTNISFGTNDRTYEGYKILNVTTSLKPGDSCADAHNPTCYNYAYTVNTKYIDILRAEVFNAGGEDLPDTAAEVTEQDIIDYLAAKTDDVDMREVADRIYRAIKAASPAIASDKTVNDAEAATKTITEGYWLFADVTDLSGKNEANSLVMVNTAGQLELNIQIKTDLPSVEKKVKDVNDTTGASAWQDSADYDVNDTVPFKLIATLTSKLDSYEAYAIKFHDSLAAGLTFKADTVKVYLYANEAAAEADADLTSNTKTDVTAAFTKATEDLEDDCSFEVSCADVKNIVIDENPIEVTKDSVFVVYYEATLNNNAVIGGTGNPNEVYLEYTNDPYTATKTGKTTPDKVVVFTYQLTINKTDVAGNALKGAGFILSKKNAEGDYVAIGEELKGADMTTFTWSGLDDGDYMLEEKTVPAGYNKMADIEFTISAEHSAESADPALTTVSVGDFSAGNFAATGIITKDIINQSGTLLPETGAMGTVIFITCGALIATVAAVFMITRKKMSIYED